MCSKLKFKRLLLKLTTENVYILDIYIFKKEEEKEERKREEEKKENEITVDTFNNGEHSCAGVTRGLTESKSVIDLSVLYGQLT